MLQLVQNNNGKRPQSSKFPRKLCPRILTRRLHNFFPGKINCADIFTKELCNIVHFWALRNSFMCSHKSFLQRQITLSQKTPSQPNTNCTVLPTYPASPPKQSVQQKIASPSLSLPNYLPHILSTLGFLLDRLVQVQQG